MNAEALDEEIHWQEVISGHLKWAAEIEERLDVKVEVVLTGYGHIFDHGKIFGEPSDVCAAKAEMIECERHVEQLYYSITLLQHDPILRGVIVVTPKIYEHFCAHCIHARRQIRGRLRAKVPRDFQCVSQAR